MADPQRHSEEILLKEMTAEDLQSLSQRGWEGLDVLAQPGKRGQPLMQVLARDRAGDPVGQASAFRTEEEGVVEVAFWVSPERRRQGIGTEVCRQMVRLLFARNARRVQMACSERNVASVRIAETLGACLRARLPSGCFEEKELRTVLLFEF